MRTKSRAAGRLIESFILLILALSSWHARAESLTFARGAFTENVVTLKNAAQTYTLYLPSRYTSEHRWPVLLVFDPRQRGTLAAEIFREAAERHGWILVSSNQTRSDGAMQPNIDAVNALWPEVHQRFSSDPRRIYAGGFSGGGILSLLLATTAPLAGVIESGGRLAQGIEIRPPGFAHFGSAGSADFNYVEMRKIDDLLASMGAPHRFEQFEGPHRWMPKTLAADAIEWMELQAMKSNLRPSDPSMIREALAKGTARGEELEHQGKLDEAARQYRWMVETLEGLADVASLREALKRLDSDPRTKRLRADERRSFRYEDDMNRLVDGVLRAAPGEGTVPLASLLSDLRLDELRSRVRKGSYEGEAAQRVLETIYVQSSFYLYQQAIEAKDYRRAALMLTIAEEVRPGSSTVLYNLACALARSGDTKRSLAVLSQAVQAGFHDAHLLLTDADLAPIRARPEFKALVAKLEE